MHIHPARASARCSRTLRKTTGGFRRDVGYHVGELLFGAERSSVRDDAMAKLARIAAQIIILPLPLSAADHYGDIRAYLTAQGQIIGANDLWIAAHARAERLTVVTHNVSEFRRVPGLLVEDWS